MTTITRISNGISDRSFYIWWSGFSRKGVQQGRSSGGKEFSRKGVQEERNRDNVLLSLTQSSDRASQT